MADANGRNFRAFYYETLGLRNVEQRKALEILLKDDPIDVNRVATFCVRFSLPAVYRTHVWKIILGILPPYQENHKFVMEQRQEQYNDLQHALQVMHKVSSEDELAERMCKIYLLEAGAMRFVKIPKDFQRKAMLLKSIIHVFSDMFEDEVNLYWLSVKFLKNQEQLAPHWEKLTKLVQHYLQIEDAQLYQHLSSLGAFEHLPYKRWFESSFIEDIRDSCMERVLDKVVAGSCKILVFVAVTLLIVSRRFLLGGNTIEEISKYLDKPVFEDSCVIIINKAMEMWDQHGTTIISEAPTVH